MTADVIRFLILLAVFASVFLLLQAVLRSTVDRRAHAGAVNKRLRLIATGADRENIVSTLRKNDPLLLSGDWSILRPMFTAFRRNLTMASVPISAAQVVLAMAAIFAALVLVVATAAWSANYALTGGVLQLIIAFAAATAVGVPVMVIGILAERRRKKMQAQFPVALDIFVRALRSGHPISGALEILTQEMEDPIGTEFGLVSDEVSYGADLTEALNDMAERWDLDDIRMFVVSLAVQNETGGNLAEILNNLSQVIRERTSLLLKVRALSSEGRMTGWLLTGLPVLTFVILFLTNPAFYLDVAEDPIFYIGFPILLLWFVLGVAWIRKLVNIKV
jgi:tight adherence protein B